MKKKNLKEIMKKLDMMNGRLLAIEQRLPQPEPIKFRPYEPLVMHLLEEEYDHAQEKIRNKAGRMNSMPKYRKKPVVIEAVQWTGSNVDEIKKFVRLNINVGKDWLVIPTLEGHMRANVGDYIIRGINGEFYPCKPDIFDKTYEKVEESGSFNGHNTMIDKALDSGCIYR